MKNPGKGVSRLVEIAVVRLIFLLTVVLAAILAIQRCDLLKSKPDEPVKSQRGELRLEQNNSPGVRAEPPVREALPWIRDALEQRRERAKRK